MPDILALLDIFVPEVFEKMARYKLTVGNGEAHAARPSVLSGVTGAVSLTGKASGVVYTSFSEKLAQSVAERILGCPDLGESDVSDVVGELTNMVTGNLKSQLSDLGYPCQLSIPTVMRGGQIAIVAKDAPLSIRNTYHFVELDETLTVHMFALLES